MTNSVFEGYFAKLDDSQKLELEKIRLIVNEIAPDATEVMSYGIPGFKYDGQYLLGFAAFKDHLSLFPTPGPIKALKHKLENYKTAKGSIQFTKNNMLPELLIKEIIKHRLSEIVK
ncbi:DUF1801 domain-containing protein [Candidatus Roizmanbacteria bacterium]|nr:DUF1801 domain-containing protein [Candidatus Roizmanbacteria bacterium]